MKIEYSISYIKQGSDEVKFQACASEDQLDKCIRECMYDGHTIVDIQQPNKE